MIHIGHSVFDIGANPALQAMVLLAVLAGVFLAELMFGWLVMDILHAGLRYGVEEPWTVQNHLGSNLGFFTM